jgi:hypothetical protein
VSGPTPAAKAYRVWQKEIVQTWNPVVDVKAYPGIDLPIAKIDAIAIALHGNYGRDCWPSDSVIGKQIGRDRKTVQRYRQFLIDHGALAPTGRAHGRVKDLSISAPSSAVRQAEATVTQLPVRKAAGDFAFKVKDNSAASDDPWSGDFSNKLLAKSGPAMAVPDDNYGTAGDIDEYRSGLRERRERRELARVAAGNADRPRRMYLGDD